MQTKEGTPGKRSGFTTTREREGERVNDTHGYE